MTWQQWKEEFLKQLSDTPHLVDAQAKYERIVQKEGEKIQAYISKAGVLLMRIAGTGNLANIDIKYHSALVKGLRNRTFRNKVAGKQLDKCRNMQEIVKIIHEVDEQERRKQRYEDVSEEEEGEQSLEENEAEIDEVRLKGRYKGQRNYGKGTYKKDFYKKNNQRYQKGNKFDLTCWFCEGKGHTFSDCFKAKYWKKFNKMTFDEKIEELN